MRERLYALIANEEENARVCKDIPEAACTDVPANFFRLLGAQTATKLGDALSDPKLVLTWMLSVLGAPAAAIGMLVPVREAGALLPQLAIGGALRRRPIRKHFWVGGAVVQAAAVLSIALTAALLRGAAAGWTTVALLAVFSFGRAASSVSSKDIQGKTIPRTRRGRLSGLAEMAAGGIALGVGLFFAVSDPEGFGGRQFALLLTVAGAAWLAGALTMARVVELPGAVEGGGNALKVALHSLRFLAADVDFRNFCIARALLAGTVLSMPYYVILAREATAGRLAGLGVLMVAASAAKALSAPVWGWQADRSSRRTLSVAGLAVGLIGVATFLVSGFAVSGNWALAVYGGLYLLVALAHTGIRVGRQVYILDMAPADRRASYVAVSNTLIGVVLLLSGSVGLLAPAIGARGVVLVFAMLGLAGGGLAWFLREVED